MSQGTRSRGYTFDDGKEKSLQEVSIIIRSSEIRNHIPRSETIAASGLSKSAFYDCLKHPEKWRLGTLYDIYQRLRVPQEARRYG